jgi:O-glycosyl hydrolase
MNAKKFGLCNLLLVFILQISAQDVTIDLNDLKQTITGFGGAHSPEWGVELTSDQIDKVFGNAPGQIGLTILRVPVPTEASLFPIELPGAARAKLNGAIILASPWSPPAYMKTNNSVVQGKLDTAYYDEYAFYLDSFATYMTANGAPLYAVSLQNEPDWLPTYTSCGWTPDDFVNFLTKSGSKITSTKVLATESLNFNHDYTDPILNSPTAEPHVDIIGGHLYGSGGIQDYPLAREKSKEVWMTEHYVAGTSYGADMATAKEIHDCMMVNYNAYVYWYAIHETGFISVGGDILKRGYVMSQFSKFIRPGSTRVSVNTGSVENVDISAYVNDTNLVIVAINRNSDSVSLDMAIQNGTDYSLTKFVTSESKNVYNDSIVNTSGGEFTATLDAMSITTFTTFPDNGGRIGNIPPLANAGNDTTITDSDGDGSELITLDGSASSDEDGSVTMFTWSEAGKQIAAGMNPGINIKTGVHHILLTITDSDGAIATDSVTVTVNLQQGQTEVHLWFEAECANVGDNWDILVNPDASLGIYLEIEPENQNLSSASEDSADHVSLSFDVAEAGEYTVWVRSRVPTADDDSYWVKMDDGNWTMWNNIEGGSTFQWDNAPNGASSTYTLSAGEHVLTFSNREDGTELDKIYITNTGTVPTGFGSDALSCAGVLRPNANAGSNQNFTVSDSTDKVEVTLDGSSSTDSDGTIISYIWYLNDTIIATGSNPTIDLPIGRHEITLIVTDDNGGTDYDKVIINVNTATNILSNLKNSDFSFRVFPNPFTDKLHVIYSLNEAKYVKIELIDNTGRLISILVNSNINSGEYSIEIDGNKIKNGIYYLIFNVEHKFYKCSLIIKN